MDGLVSHSVEGAGGKALVRISNEESSSWRAGGAGGRTTWTRLTLRTPVGLAAGWAAATGLAFGLTGR